MPYFNIDIYRYGPRTKHHVRFSLVEWASQPENKKAWEQLMAASGGQLTDNPFEDVVANFSFGDAALIQLNSLNMNKARRLGWTGFVDTIEVSFFPFLDPMGTVSSPPADHRPSVFSKCIPRLLDWAWSQH